MAELKIGDAAPDIALPVTGGGEFKLADHRGKPVVVFFYPEDDTKSCTAEAIDFSALAGDFEAAGAALVGISPDTIAKHDKFRAKHGLIQPLASDERRAALEAYGVWAQKSMYGRSYMGVVRSTFLIGPDGRIAKIWSNLRVKGHAAEVLEAVKAL